MKFVKVWRCEV